jgi:hypothetical protein
MIDQLRTLLAKLITARNIGPSELRARAWLWLASATDSLEEKRRYLAKALTLLVVALSLVACGPTPPPAPKTVPVTTKLVETIEPEQPTGNTVILLGKVIDSVTREEIPFAQVTIESNRGKMRFDSSFTFSFPTMSVITLTVTAPGYEPRQEVMKPHYRRDVTLTIDIPLAPIVPVATLSF